MNGHIEISPAAMTALGKSKKDIRSMSLGDFVRLAFRGGYKITVSSERTGPGEGYLRIETATESYHRAIENITS